MSSLSQSSGGSALAPTMHRRSFLAAAAGAAAGALVAPAWAASNPGKAPASPTSETLAAQLHGSLDEAQRAVLCRPFEDPLRDKVDNNWMITGRSIRDVLRPDQQDLVRQVFRALHQPEHADAMMRQMVEDSEGKGFEGGTSVALFGEPRSGKFELVLTGRHCTRRCDGDAVAGAAFGGPIFYGHQAGPKDEEPADHPGNVFWYQARRANDLFQALDGKQRARALVDGHSRRERATETVRLSGQKTGLPGLRAGDMTPDQRRLMRDVLASTSVVVTPEAVEWAKRTPLDHWGTYSCALTLQGPRPRKLLTENRMLWVMYENPPRIPLGGEDARAAFPGGWFDFEPLFRELGIVK